MASKSDQVTGHQIPGESSPEAEVAKPCQGELQDGYDFRELADHLAGMIRMSDADKRCTYFNRSWLAFTGRSLAAELGDGWTRGVHPEDLDRCLKTYEAAFDAREPFTLEYRLRRHDGQYRWILDSGQPWFDKEHRFAGYLASCVDVHQRRQNEQQLKETEERFDSLLRSLDDVVWSADIDGPRLLYVNPAAERVYGRSLSDFYDNPNLWFEAIHPDDRDQAADCATRLMEHGKATCEYRILRPDGTTCWILDRKHVVYSRAGTPSRIGGIATDITAEKELQQRLRLTQFSVNSSRSAVLWIEPDGRFSYVNNAACQSLGYTRDELLLLSVPDINPDRSPSIWAERWSQLCQSGSSTYETRHRRKDGTIFPVEVTAHYVRFDGREFVFAFAADVTERKQADEWLRQQNRLLKSIKDVQAKFISDATPAQAFEGLLSTLISISDSKYGFIGDVLHDEEGRPYLKTQAITDIAWNAESREFYDTHAPDAMEFRSLQTLFGAVLTTGKVVVANDPANDPQRGGIPAGHPPLDSFLGVPLYWEGELVGMAGIANRPGGYSQGLVECLQPLLGVCASLLSAYRFQRMRNEAVEALCESEVRFGQLAESIDQVFWFQSLKPRRMLYVSPAFERIWKLPVEALYEDADVWTRSVHADDQERTAKLFEAWSDDERSDYEIEYRIVRPDGSIRWILDVGTKIMNEFGQVVRISGIAKDITERRRAEEALRESEFRFCELASHITEVFWLIDWSNREVLYVSPAYETVWGRNCQSAYEAPDNWVQQVVPDDCQRVARAFIATAATGQYDEEFRIVRPDGQQRWMRDRAFPIRDGIGTVYRIARITEDITMRKDAAEQQRRQHDELVHVARLSTMGEMMAGLAHEINQPLYAIANYSAACSNTLAAETNIDISKVRQWTDQIAKQAERAGQIINRLGKFVRKAEPHRSTTDLNELVGEAIEFIDVETRQRGVKLRLDLTEPGPLLLVDRVQIQQVLINLLQNAFEALDTIDVRERTVVVRSSLGEDTVKVSVEDNGPGFTVDPNKLFDTFFTTKKDGVGMGLAISRSIIDSHGGTLWVTNNSSGGATFHFTLALVQLNAAHVN